VSPTSRHDAAHAEEVAFARARQTVVIQDTDVAARPEGRGWVEAVGRRTGEGVRGTTTFRFESRI